MVGKDSRFKLSFEQVYGDSTNASSWKSKLSAQANKIIQTLWVDSDLMNAFENQEAVDAVVSLSMQQLEYMWSEGIISEGQANAIASAKQIIDSAMADKFKQQNRKLIL